MWLLSKSSATACQADCKLEAASSYRLKERPAQETSGTLKPPLGTIGACWGPLEPLEFLGLEGSLLEGAPIRLRATLNSEPATPLVTKSGTPEHQSIHPSTNSECLEDIWTSDSKQAAAQVQTFQNHTGTPPNQDLHVKVRC